MVEEDSVEMDAIAAHLDRGWDLASRGELLGARVSANHILEIDPDSPEGHTLLGAIAAAEGEPEEAIEFFRRALDTDPEHVDALLYAAELAIHPLQQLDYALRLCDEAEELLGSAQEGLEVLVLRAEAYLARGEIDTASAVLDRLPPPPYADAAQYLRAGRALLDVERPDDAAQLLEQALTHPACELDALYFLGVARDLAGDPRGALRRFLAVYEKDRGLPAPSWSQSIDCFSKTAREVVDRFPKPMGDALRNATLQVQEYPPMELVAEGFDPRAPVFFAGTWGQPKSDGASAAKRGRRKAAQREQIITGIFVYKQNVERFAGSEEAICDELFRALAHEAAFFFELDPDELESVLGVPVC